MYMDTDSFLCVSVTEIDVQRFVCSTCNFDNSPMHPIRIEVVSDSQKIGSLLTSNQLIWLS